MLRLLLLCFPFYFSAQFALQTNLLLLVNDPQLKGTKWSVCAIDLNTGDTLAAYDAAQQLPGASIVKLVSTAAALNILCLLYTSPSPRDRQKSRMPSSA